VENVAQNRSWRGLWEISENLHRAELTALERDKLIAEWARMVGKNQVAQVAPARSQYEKRGEREAARQLGLPRDDVRRAVKVASLTPEAQGCNHRDYALCLLWGEFSGRRMNPNGATAQTVREQGW
jgi:hypothetical protein